MVSRVQGKVVGWKVSGQSLAAGSVTLKEDGSRGSKAQGGEDIFTYRAETV